MKSLRPRDAVQGRYAGVRPPRASSVPFRALAGLTMALAVVVSACDQTADPVDDVSRPSPTSTSEIPSAVDSPNTSGHLDGAWPDGTYELAGYGYVLEVHNGVPDVAVQTAHTCVRPGPHMIGEILRVGRQMGTSGDLVLNAHPEAVTEYLAEAATKPTGGCAMTSAPDTSSSYSARALMEVLDERYPFFELRGIDWPELRVRYEQRLAGTTSVEDFRALAAEMTAEINDGHTYVAGQEIVYKRDALLDGFAAAGVDDAAINAHLVAYMDSVPLVADSEGSNAELMTRWGLLDDHIGYIRLDSLDVDHDLTLAEFDSALDSLGGTSGLIIDLRMNGGGSDYLALEMAGRFTNSPYHAYTKYAGSAPNATSQDVYVESTSPVPYLGKIAILTGPFTASAAENLALSLQQRESPAMIVGERSAGQLSDVMPWVLPNGLEVNVGMEVYERPDGSTAEATGVMPDEFVPFEPWRTDAVVDDAITAARSVLG